MGYAYRRPARRTAPRNPPLLDQTPACHAVTWVYLCKTKIPRLRSMSDFSLEDAVPRAKVLLRHLGNRLLTGILVSVPLVVTILVLNIAYRFIDGLSAPLWRALGLQNVVGLGFISTLAMLILLGFMATHVIGKRIIEGMEHVILRVPLIAPVYNAVKQALESFRKMKGNQQFKRVAYIEYPSPGCFLFGFVTGQYMESRTGQDMTLVFLPTSPNPLTGFVVAVPSEKVVDSGLTLEQASKLIMSAGLVTPDSMDPAVPMSSTGIPPFPMPATGEEKN